MIIFNLVIIVYFWRFYSVLTIDIDLVNKEKNLLYLKLKTQSDLDKFYGKLLLSNRIDDKTILKSVATQTDIQQLVLEDKCFKSSNSILNALNINVGSMNNTFSRTDMERLLPILVNVKFSKGCRNPDASRATFKKFLFGFAVVTLINCSAFCGAIISSFRKKPVFKWILSAFIGLAVGTLTGSGIFHLIPMAYNIHNTDNYHTYLNTALITIIIIYIYYMRDQLLRIFLNVETIICTHSHGDEIPSENIKGKKNKGGLIENLKKMKPAGWMIFFGDMLHNFIDGLTLGAAFKQSTGQGLRVSFPIICEEFPHELGDIAIFLSSGLTLPQALIMNFLSACSCYLGFCLGTGLGELENIHSWIYALAGGMFIYIGLADMVPELISMSNEIIEDTIKERKPVTMVLKLKILLCQNIGLVFGFIIMFVLGKYGDRLEMLVKF